VIEQAKGVISERAGIDLAEAFSRLRTYARSSNLRLTDAARADIDGTLDPATWARQPVQAAPDHPACPSRPAAVSAPPASLPVRVLGLRGGHRHAPRMSAWPATGP
jgi:hypothetical protein